MTSDPARPLRVLHVIDSLGVGGGAEHSLVVMLPELAARGIDAEVVCLIPREGGLQAKVVDSGVRLDVVPPGRFPSRARWLRERLRDSGADLLHASLVSSCLLSRAAGRGTGVPQVNSLVQTTYDLELRAQAGISPWKLRTMATVDGFTARRYVDHFHSLTAAVTTEAVEVLGIDPSRITEIPRGRSTAQLGTRSDERRRQVRAALDVPADAPVVLNVARQDQQKSQAMLVEAFADVVARHPSALLVVAGREGNATAAITAAVAATGLERSVRLLGHRTDVPDLLAAADVFTLPSVSEGFGGAVIEAMALEVPVVVSDHPALAEVVDQGAAGVVVRRGDRADLTASILRLLDDPGAAATLGAAGHRRFTERYELGAVVDQMAALYRRVAG